MGSATSIWDNFDFDKYGKGNGPYQTASETIPVPGFVCGGPATAYVSYPTNKSMTYPLISFAHGFTAGGTKVPVDYGPKLLAGVASWGYVIISTEDAPSNYCEQETVDQIHCIQHMKNIKYKRVDWTKKVGLMGHSMGGHATVLSSANANAVKTHNIGAAVALHPVALPFKQPHVPIFYGTGSADVIVPPGGVISDYKKTTIKGKVLAEIKGATHFEPNTIGPNRWTPYAAAMMGCYLWEIPDACSLIYGKSRTRCDLCYCDKVPMTTCTFTQP